MKIYEARQYDVSETSSLKLFKSKDKALEYLENFIYEENNYYMNPQEGDPMPKEWEYKKYEINGVVFFKNCMYTLDVKEREVY